MSMKTALRSLRSNKIYGFLNITGLAVGIACAGLIFLWVGDELSFDHNQVNKNRIYALEINSSYAGNFFTMTSTPRLMAGSIKTEIPGIADAGRCSDKPVHALFNTGGKSLYADGDYADPALFHMFTFQFIAGNAHNPYPQLFSMILSESAAKKYFGSVSAALGKTLRMNNEQDFMVSAVVKDPPQNSSLQFEWLAPYEAQIKQELAKFGHSDTQWKSYGPLTYVELEAAANLGAINKALYHYIHGKDASQQTTAFLYPMTDWHLYNEFADGKATGGGRIRQVKQLTAIAWVILLIACINFTNLSTARSEKRAKEVGVRKVLGSGRKRLIAQFISESLLLSMIATLVAIALMVAFLPAFNQLVQKNLSLRLNEPLHIISLLLITVVCGLLAGLYPALYLSSFEPVKVLKGLSVRSGSATLVRKGLVVLQFTVSIVFIIGTIIMQLQMRHGQGRNLGFNKDNLVEIDMQHGFARNFPEIKQELLSTGSVQNAALSDHITIEDGNSDGRFKWEGKPQGNAIGITYRNVSPEFIATSGMHIAEGRDFTDNSGDTSNIIINRSLAKLIDKNDAIGKVIQSPREVAAGTYTNKTIIGVIDDYIAGNAYGQQGPEILFCRPQGKDISGNANLLYVRIRNGHNSQQTLAGIGAVITKSNPGYPFQYKFADDQFNALFATEVQTSKLAGLFAILAILISCLGLFSLAAYTAEKRIREIGIRKVLGASIPGIAGLLSKDFLVLVGIACLIAFPIAWWMMNDWLQSYEYRISIPWWVFALTGFAAMLIALATVSFQAIKAALANPVNSLRGE
jgi:putative ABC transport system permease protein